MSVLPRPINAGYVQQGLWTSDVPYQKQAPKDSLPIAQSQVSRAIRAPLWDPKKVAVRMNRERGLLNAGNGMVTKTEANALPPAPAAPEKKKSVSFLELAQRARRPRASAAIQVTTLPAAQWPEVPVTSRHPDLIPKTALTEPSRTSTIDKAVPVSQPAAVPKAKKAPAKKKKAPGRDVKFEAPEDRHLFYANRMARNPMYTPKTHFAHKQYSFNRKSRRYIEHFYYYYKCWPWNSCFYTKQNPIYQAVKTHVVDPVVKAVNTAANWVNDKVIKPTVNFVKNTYNNIKNAVGGCCKANQSKFGLLCGIQCDKLNPPMTDFGLWCGGGGTVKAKHTFGKKSRAKEREFEYGSDIDDGDDD